MFPILATIYMYKRINQQTGNENLFFIIMNLLGSNKRKINIFLDLA